MSRVEIEFALEGNESQTQDGDTGGDQTETEEPPHTTATGHAAPIQSKAAAAPCIDLSVTNSNQTSSQ